MDINQNLQNARLKEQQALKKFEDSTGIREAQLRAKPVSDFLKKGQTINQAQQIKERQLEVLRQQQRELKTAYQLANYERRKLEGLESKKQIQRSVQQKKQPIQTQPIQTQQRTLNNDTIKKAQNILNKVSKSGSITPQERNFFINNRLDTKILSKSAISYNVLNKVSRGERVTFKELTSAGLTPNQATEILLKASEEKDVRDLGKLGKDIFNENLKEFNKKLEDPTIIVDSTTQRASFKIQVNKELEKLGEKKLPASASIKEYENKLKERILPRQEAKEYFKINNELINEINKKTQYKVNKGIILNFLGKKNKEEREYYKVLSKVSKGQTLTNEDKKILNSNIAIKNSDKFGREIAKGLLFDAPKKSIILAYNFGKDLSKWAGKLGSFIGDKFGEELGEVIRRIRDDKLKDTQTYLENRYFKTPLKTIFKSYVNGIKTQKQLIDSTINLFKKNPNETLNDLALIMGGAVVIGGAVATNLKYKLTSKIAEFIRKKGARGVGELIGVTLIELSDWYTPNKIKKIKNVSNLNKLFKLIDIDSKDVKIINSIINKSKGVLKADDLKNITKIINRNTGLLLDVKNVKNLNKNDINLIKLLIKNRKTNNYQKFDFGVKSLALKGLDKIDDLLKSSKIFKSKNSKRINFLSKKILDLESKGINIRQRTKMAEKLRLLKEELRIMQSSLEEIDNIIKKVSIVKKTKNKTNLEKTIKNIEKETISIKKKNVKANKLKKKSEVIKIIKQDFGNFFNIKKFKKVEDLNIKEVKDYKILSKELDNRISQLIEKIVKPMTSEKARLRINNEISSLKKLQITIEKQLKLKTETINKLSNIDKKIFFKKINDFTRNYIDYSIFLEEFIKLDKKIKKIDKNLFLFLFNDKKKLDKKLIKALELYEKSLSYSELSKAKKGLLLKRIKKINKETLVKKIDKIILNDPKKIKKLIERNSFTKLEIEELLKKVDSKTKLNKQLKDIDKRINALKTNLFSATTLKKYNINKRIKILEDFKKTLISNFKDGIVPLNEKKIIERLKQRKFKFNNIKITSSDIINKNPKKVIKLGDFEVEINLKNIGLGFRTQVNSIPSLELPQVIKIRRVNKNIPISEIKKYNDNLKMVGNKGVVIYNKNQRLIINNRNKLNRLLKNKNLPNIKTIKIKTALKSINQLEVKNLNLLSNLLKLNIKLAVILTLQQTLKIKSQLQLKNKLQLQLKNKLQLQLKNKQLLKESLKLNLIIDNKIKNVFEIVKKKERRFFKNPKITNPKITKTTIKPNIKIPKISISKPKIKIPKIPPLPKLNFDSKKLDNKVLNAEAVFRERKYRNKLAGKNNPVITKKINIRDTKNRILKRVRDRVDNSLTASLELKIVGIGKKKKDINKPSLSKFRVKKSKNSAVLKLVEANKNRFDTKGEVREAKKQKAKKKIIKKKTIKKSKSIKTKKIKRYVKGKKKNVKKNR